MSQSRKAEADSQRRGVFDRPVPPRLERLAASTESTHAVSAVGCWFKRIGTARDAYPRIANRDVGHPVPKALIFAS